MVSGLTKALSAQGITTTVRTIGGGQQPKTSKTMRAANRDVNGEVRTSNTQRDEDRYAGLGMKHFIVQHKSCD